MTMMGQRDLLKALAWVFIGSAFAQSLYSGIKYGCWLGFCALTIGLVSGFIYSALRGRRHKAK